MPEHFSKNNSEKISKYFYDFLNQEKINKMGPNGELRMQIHYKIN